MSQSPRFQHFALDNNNNLIDIKNADNTTEKQYYCPYCHKEMIPKRGNRRQWHYAHKNLDQCSYDKYLHSIAEIMIMDWFIQNDSIILCMKHPEKCDKYDSCVFYNDQDCVGTTIAPIDLKKYYTTCIREHKFGGFIADLYCNSDAYPQEPIFIEIYVTHECSPPKKESGIRIIELVIQSEEDILNIIKSDKLEESDTVRLYNFKRTEHLVNNFKRPFQKYILYPITFKSYVDWCTTTCKNYSDNRKGMYEISMPYDKRIPYFFNSGGLYGVGKVKAYLDGCLTKDCQLCKWSVENMKGNRLCKLYGINVNAKYYGKYVLNCSKFEVDEGVIKCAISDFDKYLQKGHVDIWKLDDRVSKK